MTPTTPRERDRRARIVVALILIGVLGLATIVAGVWVIEEVFMPALTRSAR